MFTKQKLLDLSTLTQFADDNLKVYDTGRKFSNRVENNEGKGDCPLKAIFPFFTLFSKDLYCRHIKKKTWLCLRYD